jgi:hypothetical protein
MVLTGQLTAASLTNQLESPKTKSPKDKKKKERVPTWEDAMSTFFVGVAFLVIFFLGLLFVRRAFMIWGWFILPALGCMGSGLGDIVHLMRLKNHPAQLEQPQPVNFIASQPHIAELPSRNTTEFMTPPSVTEHTTRHLVEKAKGKRQKAKDKNESEY